MFEELTGAGVPSPFAALGLTFDDVLLQPNQSDIIPSQVSTSTQLTRRIRLNIPLASAAMERGCVPPNSLVKPWLRPWPASNPHQALRACSMPPIRRSSWNSSAGKRKKRV